MRVVAKKRFSSSLEGNVVPGMVLQVTEERAAYLAGLGNVEIMEAKPDPLTREKKPALYASRPAPASQPQMSSDVGVSSSSQSTIAGESLPGQTSSTPATSDGGTTTSKALDKGSKANSGRKTRRRRKNTNSTEL